MSRTQPPAKKAMWLCSRSFVAMARAVSSIAFTVTSFALRGLVGQPFPVASLGDGQAGFLLVEPYSSERTPDLQF
jgi:hypothetical protein